MTNLTLIKMTIAGMWFYQGFVPKLLGPHADELAMNMALGLTIEQATIVSYIAGAAEVIMGVVVLVCWRHRWPLQLTAIAMLGLLFYVVIMIPGFLVGAFNPVIMNLAILALAMIGLRLFSQDS